MTYDRETQERVLPCVRQLQDHPCGQGNSHPLFPVSCYPPTLSHHQSLLFLTFAFFLWCSGSTLPPLLPPLLHHLPNQRCEGCQCHSQKLLGMQLTLVCFLPFRCVEVWYVWLWCHDYEYNPVHKVWAGLAASFVLFLVFSIPLPLIGMCVQEAPPYKHVLLSALENWGLDLWWVTSRLHDSPDIQTSLRRVHSFSCLKKNSLLLWKRSQKSSKEN